MHPKGAASLSLRLRRQIRANHIIAAHIPLGKLDEVKELVARDWPEVIVFENALDSRAF